MPPDLHPVGLVRAGEDVAEHLDSLLDLVVDLLEVLLEGHERRAERGGLLVFRSGVHPRQDLDGRLQSHRSSTSKPWKIAWA